MVEFYFCKKKSLLRVAKDKKGSKPIKHVVELMFKVIYTVCMGFYNGQRRTSHYKYPCRSDVNRTCKMNMYFFLF